MDEVDNIVLYHLRSLGCEIDPDVHGLKQFTTAMFVEATARCIRAIDPSIDVHFRLPPSMAAQFRVGASIAAAVQNIGYHGDIGYHTFMYLNEKDIRRILIFLVDRLPKDQSELKANSYGTLSIFQRAISDTASGFNVTIWAPLFCDEQQSGFTRTFSSCHLLLPNNSVNRTFMLPTEDFVFIASYLPYICMQPYFATDVTAAVLETNLNCFLKYQLHNSEWIQYGQAASVLSGKEHLKKKKNYLKEKVTAKFSLYRHCQNQGANSSLEDLTSWHRDGNESHCIKRSRFLHVQRQQFTQVSDSVLNDVVNRNNSNMEQTQQQEENANLRLTIMEIDSNYENIITQMKHINLGTQQITKYLSELNSNCMEKVKLKTEKKQAVNLLPDANINIVKLTDMIDSSSKRLLTLSRQLEKHRVPLMKQYKEAADDASETMKNKENHMDEVLWQQARMKDLIIEAREKDAVYKQLLLDYQNMVREVNRSAYTQRIMEIVGNIRKQNLDIDKVLQDTNAVQKEINFLSGKLDRIFTVTDEIIFKDAKKDDAVRKAYKYLASLHENWSAIIKTVEETGAILKQTRDLDDQLEAEDRTKVFENLQQIGADYQHILLENNALLAKLS